MIFMASSAEINQYIAAIETFLASNIGVTSIKHPDNRQITLDRKQALVELNYWNSQKIAKAGNYKFGISRFRLKGDI